MKKLLLALLCLGAFSVIAEETPVQGQPECKPCPRMCHHRRGHHRFGHRGPRMSEETLKDFKAIGEAVKAFKENQTEENKTALRNLMVDSKRRFLTAALEKNKKQAEFLEKMLANSEQDADKAIQFITEHPDAPKFGPRRGCKRCCGFRGPRCRFGEFRHGGHGFGNRHFGRFAKPKHHEFREKFSENDKKVFGEFHAALKTFKENQTEENKAALRAKAVVMMEMLENKELESARQAVQRAEKNIAERDAKIDKLMEKISSAPCCKKDAPAAK